MKARKMKTIGGIEEKKKKKILIPSLSSHCLQSYNHFFLSKYTTSSGPKPSSTRYAGRATWN
jgi:hypothetical protein